MLCLMDKNGNMCPSKNVTLAYQHVSYLENDLVLMAQFFTTFSFCKYVQFKQQNISNIMTKEKLFWKIYFPYTAIVPVSSLVKHAIYYLYKVYAYDNSGYYNLYEWIRLGLYNNSLIFCDTYMSVPHWSRPTINRPE